MRTDGGTWVVPPRRAVWIPAKTPHSITMSGPVSMRTLYLRARLAQQLPRNCCVVNVSPLLQELILHACQFPRMNRKSRVHSHLIDLILDQLDAVQAIPLQLPTPVDSRAQRVAEILQEDSGEIRSLAAACRQAGASNERLSEFSSGRQISRWENGDSNCDCCDLCSCLPLERRSPARRWRQATARRAHSSQCSGKPLGRHRGATSKLEQRLRVAEVDHHRRGTEPVRLVSHVEDSDRKPDASDRLGDNV